MTTRVSVRSLRNSTREVIDRVHLEGEVILTNNGQDVAIIHPISSQWAATVDRVISTAPPPHDTGMLRFLDADDAASMDDLS